MNDFALVLNAGSSSLKFCVYRKPADSNWKLEAVWLLITSFTG